MAECKIFKEAIGRRKGDALGRDWDENKLRDELCLPFLIGVYSDLDEAKEAFNTEKLKCAAYEFEDVTGTVVSYDLLYIELEGKITDFYIANKEPKR